MNEQMKKYYETHPLPEGTLHQIDVPGPNPPRRVHHNMPDITPEQLESPEFQAIWEAIKTWDINVPECYYGYCGANGSHVVLILNALLKARADTISSMSEQ